MVLEVRGPGVQIWDSRPREEEGKETRKTQKHEAKTAEHETKKSQALSGLDFFWTTAPQEYSIWS